MASHLTRRYNRTPQQLREAAMWAMQSRFPGSFVHESAPWQFTLKRGMHWPLTSYGETVDVRVCAGGVVEIGSRYQMPTQIFELGNNHENVEAVARGIDDRCNSLAPSCPHCSAALGQAAALHCTACGGALHRAVPVPARARGARVASCLVLLLIALLPLAMVLLYPLWLENSLIME